MNILCITRDSQGFITGMFEVPGDRRSWRFWFGHIRAGARERNESLQITRSPIETKGH